MNDLQRFIACMEYGTADRRPNHELGVWAQTALRWQREAPEAVQDFSWGWFHGEDALGLDRREYIPVNFGFIPPFEPQLIEETEAYEIYRDWLGIVHKALKEGAVGGARMCMDQYRAFPVSKPEDFAEVKKRLVAAIPERYPADLEARIK